MCRRAVYLGYGYVAVDFAYKPDVDSEQIIADVK